MDIPLDSAMVIAKYTTYKNTRDQRVPSKICMGQGFTGKCIECHDFSFHFRSDELTNCVKGHNEL